MYTYDCSSYNYIFICLNKCKAFILGGYQECMDGNKYNIWQTILKVFCHIHFLVSQSISQIPN